MPRPAAWLPALLAPDVVSMPLEELARQYRQREDLRIIRNC
jgi:hypothetical protein